MAKAKINDIIFCPYCGKKGRVANVFADDSGMFVIHRCEKTETVSAATGLRVVCEILKEACRGGQKLKYD